MNFRKMKRLSAEPKEGECFRLGADYRLVQPQYGIWHGEQHPPPYLEQVAGLPSFPSWHNKILAEYPAGTIFIVQERHKWWLAPDGRVIRYQSLQGRRVKDEQ